MIDLTVLRTQLAEAQLAYHRLQTGGSVRVFVDQNGERVEYTLGNKADLYGYIQRLQAQIDCGGRFEPAQPLQFFF